MKNITIFPCISSLTMSSNVLCLDLTLALMTSFKENELLRFWWNLLRKLIVGPLKSSLFSKQVYRCEWRVWLWCHSSIPPPQDRGDSGARGQSWPQMMSFICHIHNYTEYNEEWNVFSAFNPSKWSSGQPTLPREQLGFGAALKGRGHFLPEPGFEPTTLGYLGFQVQRSFH